MAAPNIEFFSGAQGVQAERIKFVTKISSPAGIDPLERLRAEIAPGAIHDSKERCDAPKCQSETRVAVQDDLYDWIMNGDGESEQPKKIKWVTGPAGSGKTAIMGSLSERCVEDGVLAATFFFSSWSGSIGRRRKTAFVTTIAHQLAQYHSDLREEISKAIIANPDIFDKNLHVQMRVLVLGPLHKIGRRQGGSDLRGAIIVDGVDECEAEQYQDTTATGSKFRSSPARTKEQDQLEILQVLQMASSDPSFPFRTLIASRPERVFREFFDPDINPIPFARKLDLHEDYNADDDIALFFEVQFSRIRRRYNLPDSWASSEIIRALVEKASGQFIYAATVIRFLNTDHREPPEALLASVLNLESTRKATSNPLEQLDMLYTHILESSPDLPLSVWWIRSIDMLRHSPSFERDRFTASNINVLLQTDPESSEAERLLGPLHSLIRIPPPSDQATAQYELYHKSLLDFLEDPNRCGRLNIQWKEVKWFIWDRFNRACARGCDTRFSYPENFLALLAHLPQSLSLFSDSPPPTPAGADWWVSLAIAHKQDVSLWNVFAKLHNSCPWYRCKPACRIWSRTILRRLESPTWIAPGVFWPQRVWGLLPVGPDPRFDRLIKKAAKYTLEDLQDIERRYTTSSTFYGPP